MGFLILCIASATINAGAVAIVTAAIVKMAIPSLMFDAGTVAALIMASCLIILVSGRYRALDRVSKIIIVTLSIATLAAAGIAMSRGMQMQPDFIEPTPWTLAGLGFLIALMGWMPAPIEISAINSLWVTENNASILLNTATGFSISTSVISPVRFWLWFSLHWARLCNTATAKQCRWRAANISGN